MFHIYIEAGNLWVDNDLVGQMGVKDFTQVCGAEYRIIFNTYVKDKHGFVNTSHKALRMLS